MNIFRKNGREFLTLFLLFPLACLAIEVTVVGLFPNKAVVSINGGSPRTLSVGQKTSDGIKLISTTNTSAIFEIEGKEQTLTIGERSLSLASSSDDDKVVLSADTRGHFFTLGSINGGASRFMVDTGASTVALSLSEAQRLRIDYKKGERLVVSTPNGAIVAYKVNLDRVRVGNITLNNVVAAVADNDSLGDMILLGMSFLGRLDIQRDGQYLTLTQRKDAATSKDSARGRPSVKLTADKRGHFLANGSINGSSITFLVDTGASGILISASDARHAGINYREGEVRYAHTANGLSEVYRVRLNTVKIGDIVLYNVDADVSEATVMGAALLGMTFLSRMEIKREGDTMTLIKRY